MSNAPEYTSRDQCVYGYKQCDKEVIVMQVIRTALLRRGDGKTTPMRIITQYWSMEGDLLAEVDPLPQQPISSEHSK